MSTLPQAQAQPHPLSKEFSCLQLWIPNSDPRVAVVVMDRVRKRNAISTTMWKEIGRVFSVLGTNGEDCRCILLMGAGTKAFTSGIDVSDPAFGLASGTDEADVARRGLRFYPQILEMQRCFTQLEECPVPVIAAIQGSCIGAGIDLASACDIRLCSTTTTFSVREVKIGLAADVGTLQRFPKITGNDSRVRELCLTGEVFGAQEALRIGFVSRITDQSRLVIDALELATTIAENSPVAVIGTKRSLVYSRDHTVADGLVHIATHNTAALMTDDLPKAMMAASLQNKKQAAEFDKIPKLSKL